MPLVIWAEDTDTRRLGSFLFKAIPSYWRHRSLGNPVCGKWKFHKNKIENDSSLKSYKFSPSIEASTSHSLKKFPWLPNKGRFTKVFPIIWWKPFQTIPINCFYRFYRIVLLKNILWIIALCPQDRVSLLLSLVISLSKNWCNLPIIYWAMAKQ